MSFLLFFFFQAEDGIRDLTVTGVQTCALPISLRGRARLGRRPQGKENRARRVPAHLGPGTGGRAAARRALLPQTALRSAQARRKAARRLLRAAVLRCLRRIAPRELSPSGNRRGAEALRRGAVRARGAHSGDDSGGRQAPGRRLGAFARPLLHAFGGFLRHGRQGGVPHRSLPASVSPLGLARIRRERGLPARAELPALPPGARRRAARARRSRRSVAVAPRASPLLRRVYDGRPFPRARASCRSRNITTS